MTKVLVTVSQAKDGSFWCHTEDEVYGGGLNGAGESVKDAKEDLMACLEDAKADYVDNGNAPYEVEFYYQYDLQSFFDYFSFLNVTEIAKRAGINPSLMRQYTRGIKNAGEKTYERLASCMESITKELQVASFR
ncbi:MAG: pilus assembly protein HicB [Prevotella sp.]|nr:pilus assembly protein HicB [Prevotella sp.]MDY6028562.1 pilus assembly protein HicB [Prevotella sp.]